jgi:hypothetical protein
VARLDALMQPFYKRATKERDVAAGTLCCKPLERRALLLGLDSPVRIDTIQLSIDAKPRPSSYEMITAAINRVIEQAPPAQRALRERVEQLGPEKALAMLNSGTSDCGSNSTA